MVTLTTKIVQHLTELRLREMAFQPTEAKLPSFLCVGAQKAGTTTLHALLGLHPMVFLPPRKEVHYFSLHYGEGLEWYRNFFDSAGEKQITGEITPYYLFHPYVAERIANDLGKVRIIILLRDPLARTLSHYSHACRHGFEKLSLGEALKAESSRLLGATNILKNIDGRHQHHQECSYLSRSLYRDQVERYWTYFGKSNVLVLPSEFMFANPSSCLQKIYNFIGAIPCIEPGLEKLKVCKNKGEKLSLQNEPGLVDDIRRRLEDSYDFARDCLGWNSELDELWTL